MRVEESSLILEESLSVDQAKELHVLLLTMVTNYPGGFTVDASRLNGIDMAILQLLVSTQRTLAAQGGQLSFQAMSPTLEKIFAEAGVSLP